MKRVTRHRCLYAWSVLLVACAAGAAEWHPALYLDGGGTWRGRIRVAIENGTEHALEGRPVTVRVGTGRGEAALVGARAEAIRVASEQGVEMLFGLTGPDAAAIESGPIPAGSTLVLPAECPARGSAAYYVYFDNPAAGQVPDFLSVRTGLVNGDVEQGRGDEPDGWKHDEPDGQHHATWSTEEPQSGKRCLKTVVAEGAEPTWISTRQGGIHVEAGAKYVMRAWVKARGVRGSAGWYIHLGNNRRPMIASPMLSGGDGTYGWKEVTAEFTAPPEADRADLGTVLRGTGTAWFDNVRLECLEPDKVRAVAEKPQRLELREVGANEPWPAVEGQTPKRRAPVRVHNFAERESAGLVSTDVSMLANRLAGRLDPASLRVAFQDKPVPHYLAGNTLLFEAKLPPRTAATYYVYYSPRASASEESGVQTSPLPSSGEGSGVRALPPSSTAPKAAPAPPPARSDFAALVMSPRNLAKNPSFESGGDSVDDWSAAPAGGKPGGVSLAPDAPGAPGLGNRCVKVSVPRGTAKNWRGWHQQVAVRPGRTYLYAAWVRCRDLRGGSLRLHAHVHDAAGALSKDNPMRSVGPAIEATADWTLMSGLLTMPADAATLQLHLTTDATGTVWYDGVLVAEVLPGRVAGLEGRPMDEPERVAVWPVNAVVKVFPDEPAPRTAAPARIELAHNEQEPLQLAVRSGRAHKAVRVEVDPPVGPGGAKLADVEIAVVGYVPVDHATSYYQSETPEWHRKFPTHPGSCDGWAGPWPDPLLPRDTLDLAANATGAVWITLAAPKDAASGDYRGRVRLVEGGRTLAEVPVTVHVWDFALPDRSHLAAIYDARLGPGAKVWSESLDAAYPDLVRFMARRRLCPDAIRPAPVFQYKDGRASADFTEFDKAAAWYFDELGLPHSYTPWHFYLFGWGHPPKKVFGEQPYQGEYPYESANRSQLRPEYKRAYQACLRLFWDHLKEKGWDKRVVLYISDEPHFHQQGIIPQMQALCAMIHEVDPAILIYSSTWRHVPEWDGSLDVWGIGHYGCVPVERMKKLRAAGKRLWFTTDGQMCTDTPYCAVERLLPHYCFKHGVEAYEFWGVAWTTYDPYRFGWHSYIRQSSTPGKSYWIRYPNGDGFLIYPGAPIGHAGPVSSIRLEQAREGVEDYEYLYLLRALVEKAKAAGRNTSAAQKALDEAHALVTIPNAGGRYSSKILPDPEEVYRVRRAVAAAIETLQTPRSHL